DPHGERLAEPVRAQEDHHLLHLLLAADRLAELLDALLAEALHLAQAFRLVRDHPQSVGAEAGDDPLGDRRPDAGDQRRAEVGADPLDLGRQARLAGAHFDPRAEARVDRALAADPNLLTFS